MKQPLLLICIFTLLLAAACSPEIEPPIPTAGSLDFTRYLSIGSSAMAGVSDGKIPFNAGSGLLEGGYYEKGQSYSMPSILRRQMATTGSVAFVQPFLSGNGSGYATLQGFSNVACPAVPSPPIFTQHDPQADWGTSVSDRGPYHNLALPELRVDQLHEEGMLSRNPYASRMVDAGLQADSMSYASWIDQNDPTFFVLWLGVEDVLQFALFGGKNSQYPLTDPGTFEEEMGALIAKLMDNEQTKGIILNVPDVTYFPYFRAIGNTWYDKQCNAHDIYFQRESTGEIEVATENDYVLLSTLRLIDIQGRGLVYNNPLYSKFVLDEGEAKLLRQHVNAYNQSLEGIVDAYNQGEKRIALVDMHQFIKDSHTGIRTNGLHMDATYLEGGLFSLDGLLPTPRGNAMITNEVIHTMNEFWEEVSLPTVDITKYPAVSFP